MCKNLEDKKKRVRSRACALTRRTNVYGGPARRRIRARGAVIGGINWAAKATTLQGQPGFEASILLNMFCIMISVAVIVLVLVLLVAFLARPAPRRHDVELQTHIAQPRATANLSELVLHNRSLQDLA